MKSRSSNFYPAAVIAIAWMIDVVRRGPPDFAFWLHIFGVLAFWGGITASSYGTPVDKALYCAMNFLFLLLAAFLGRRVFAVFGTVYGQTIANSPYDINGDGIINNDDFAEFGNRYSRTL